MVEYNILQFADDTILVGDGSWHNLWSIKALLRGFELVSELSVNFIKSKLYGLNISNDFIQSASHFLSCFMDYILFKFVGIPVGFNHRRIATWRPIVDNLKKKLCSWKGKFLPFVGRVSLINSVLSNLPIYFLCFFRALKKVVK